MTSSLRDLTLLWTSALIRLGLRRFGEAERLLQSAGGCGRCAFGHESLFEREDPPRAPIASDRQIGGGGRPHL